MLVIAAAISARAGRSQATVRIRYPGRLQSPRSPTPARRSRHRFKARDGPDHSSDELKRVPPVLPDQLHHCRSQGTPSLFPSILVFGQLRRKYLASAHDVICEQWVRPSHRVLSAAASGDPDVADVTGLEAPHGGSPAGALACAAWTAGTSGGARVRLLYWSKPTRATAPTAISARKRVSFKEASDPLMTSLDARSFDLLARRRTALAGLAPAAFDAIRHEASDAGLGEACPAGFDRTQVRR